MKDLRTRPGLGGAQRRVGQKRRQPADHRCGPPLLGRNCCSLAKAAMQHLERGETLLEERCGGRYDACGTGIWSISEGSRQRVVMDRRQLERAAPVGDCTTAQLVTVAQRRLVGGCDVAVERRNVSAA